jgi:IS30 family transposase
MGGPGSGPRLRLSEGERVEVRRRVAGGERVDAVALAMGFSVRTIFRVIAKAGGVPPRSKTSSDRYLSLTDRFEIEVGLRCGDRANVIAARLGRSASAISREMSANGGRDSYQAFAAERRAQKLRARPKAEKLALNPRLRAAVEYMLEQHLSPEQISGRLPLEFPDDEEMRVSAETIYQSLFIQGRGALRKELISCLRSGRAQRRPHGRAASGRGRIKDMVMISERPAEVEDRAYPGHWEGDLVMGSTASKSAIGTLVERSSRLVLLFPLGADHTARNTRLKLTEVIRTVPTQMRRSITWDQGREMSQHAQFTADTDIQVYFCDPHSPWQRASNENTNGLLREYFPKGTDLSQVTQATCDAVAAQLNNRPRKVLGFHTPLESWAQLLATTA